jgi:hypothetical protein
MPQCQYPVFCYFCVSEKLHRKYSRNWTEQKPNLLFLPKLHKDRRWDRGGPQAGHTLGWRGPGPGRATRGWDRLVHLLTPPFRLYIPLDGKKPKGPINFPRNILQAIAIVDARSGGSRSSSRHPAGGLLHHHGRLWIDVWVVYLGLGSIAVARWSSPPPCASCLDHVSCPTWSRSSLCNSTCCVCWDPMSIGTMSSWCAELLSLCCLWSYMLSIASRYLGRVDASDSKREYLCLIVGFMPLVIRGSDINL